MDKYFNIIRILEKEEISEQEEEYLNKRADEDIEIKYFIEIYAKLEQVLKSSSHIDLEILSEFILYYDGDMDAARYIPYITDRIEDHLTSCTTCNNEYIKLNREFDQLEDYLSKSFTTDENIEYEDEPSIFSRLIHANYKAAFTAIILLIVTYMGMMLTSNYTTLPYKKNIFQFEENYSTYNSKRVEGVFQKSLNALTNEEYETAIGYLREDIIEHSQDSTIYYSRYFLGIAYLKSSENNILGTFTSYDHIRVGEGIQNLLLAIQQNTGKTDERLNIDAHYYIAKGYLAIDEIELGIEHLQIVIDLRGRYYSDAVKILKAIEDNRNE
jgi:hypothetical protein